MKAHRMDRQIGMAVLVLWGLICPVAVAMAQTDVQKGIWFKVGLLLEQVALPGVSGLKYGINPGIKIGAEYHYGSKGKFGFFHSIGYGFSVNRSFGASNVLTTQL